MNGCFQANIKLTLGQRLKFAGRLTPFCIDPYSAGTVFRRQNLTIPALKEIKMYIGRKPIT